MRALDERDRWETCLHEAGHAVVFALGGVSVQRVAVAPLGATEWRTESSGGRTCSDLWGLCVKSELILPRQLLRWMMGEGVLLADGRGFEARLRTPEGEAQLESLTPAKRREIRAQIAGLLAGPVAERVARGEPTGGGAGVGAGDSDDEAKARALTALLPDLDALAHLVAVVEQALRRPAIWAQVEGLATALAQAGEVGAGIRAWLPAPEAGWPPPARHAA